MKNELKQLEEIVEFLPHGKTLTFDMKLTNKHWLVNYEYFFVRNNFTEEQLKAETCEFSGYHYKKLESNLTPKKYLQDYTEKSIQKYWSDKISIGRVELLAWSKYTVEKDTGLCYIYNTDDKFIGIYCHCLNRPEEIIYVGRSIEDFFDLDLTKKKILEEKIDADVSAIKKKISGSQLATYDKLLQKEEYKILDGELGMTITLDLYENMIKDIFISLSNGELEYTKLELIDNLECLHFFCYVKDKKIEVMLDNKSDYIDLTIYKVLNEVLAHLGYSKRFVLFKDVRFGQEYGVAYIDSKKKKKLENLISVELIEGE